MRKLSIFLALLHLMCCATGAPASSWDTAVTTEARYEEGDGDPQAAHSSQACVSMAEAKLAEDTDAAWDMMRQCIQRKDFADVLAVSKEPWRSLLRAEPEALKLALPVALRRGPDDVTADLRAMGLRVGDLSQQAVAPDQTVVARLTFVEDDGVGVILVEQMTYDASKYAHFTHQRGVTSPRRSGFVFPLRVGACEYSRTKQFVAVGAMKSGASPKSRRLADTNADASQPVFHCQHAAVIE